jgi:hypothetical protein
MGGCFVLSSIFRMCKEGSLIFEHWFGSHVCIDFEDGVSFCFWYVWQCSGLLGGLGNVCKP